MAARVVSVGLLTGLVLAGTACSGATAGTSSPSTVRRQSQTQTDAANRVAPAASESKDPADEVCTSMTRDNVARQLAKGALTGQPVSVKSGVQTVCTYPLDHGWLRMTVDEPATNAAARATFDRLASAARPTTPVPNLGSAAFTRSDGSTVTVKDNKVLTVDTTQLPAGNDKTQISQSLSFEILACWTG